MASSTAYYLLTEDGESSNFQKAIKGSGTFRWITVMQEEIEALHRNKMSELVSLPPRKKAIGNK